MNFEPDFPFMFLRTSGDPKVLSAPNVSTHFQWNAQHVVKKNLHILVSNTSLKLLDDYKKAVRS